MDIFPWLTEFRAKCKSSLTRPSCLIKCMEFFNEKIKLNSYNCFKESSQIVKFRGIIKEATLLFMYIHRFQQPQDQNRADYLEQMSELLAVYIDVELVLSASKQDGEPQPGKISARLVSCLHVYLENSTENMLDTLIRVRLQNESFFERQKAVFSCLKIRPTRELFCKTLGAVFSKIFNGIPEQPDTGVMYVRYLLAYRLWARTQQPEPGAVQRIHERALASLGPGLPANLAPALLEQVLPAGASGQPEPSNFCLRQAFDVHRACGKFIEYCKRHDGRVTERDHRLKITHTSESNKVESVNNNSRKIPNDPITVDSLTKKMPRIAPANLDNGIKKSGPRTAATNNNSSNVTKKALVKTAKPSKKSKHNDDLVLIDLTDEEVTKIVKIHKPRRISWLEDARRSIDAKLKEAALKRDKQTAEASMKITHQPEDANRRSSSEPSTAESEPISSPVAKVIQAPESNGSSQAVSEQIVNSEPRLAIFSPPVTSKSKPAGQPTRDDSSSRRAEKTSVIERLSSIRASPSKAPRSEESSHDAWKKSQPADSTVPGAESHREPVVLSASCSVIRRSVRERPLVDAPEPKRTSDAGAVNSNATKTDFITLDKAKVKQAEPSVDSMSSGGGGATVEDGEDNGGVNGELLERRLSTEKMDGGEQPSPPNDYYVVHEPEIDGLALLASVSAQQRLSACKGGELKVKPYVSLQEKPRESSDERIVGVNQEDAIDKLALQVGVSSNDLISSTASKQQDVLSYVLDESMQNNLESNDNAKVILNGETVMLLQKSPNSNLYIINKASDSCKLEEEELEESKPIIKHEPEGRSIKSEPADYGDVVKGLEEVHYGYPAYGYPPLHHPSQVCACVSCAYCRQLSYYHPPVSASLPNQSVQATPAVQEKRSSSNNSSSSNKKQQQQDKDAVSRLKQQGSKLPLKKRFSAQLIEYAAEAPAAAAYPATLMMSIADVEQQEPPYDLGATVEVTSASLEQTHQPKGRPRKDRANHNVPNCFPRKQPATKRRKLGPAEDEFENGVPVKKPPKPSAKPKQKRASKRIAPAAPSNACQSELDPEWNPSAKRRRKRTGR